MTAGRPELSGRSALEFSEYSPIGFRALSRLPHLRQIRVSWSITADELHALCTLRQLTYLKLPERNPSAHDSRCLVELAKLEDLRTLDLTATGVDDKSVNHILPLRSLLELSLSRNENLTDMGVARLASLENLRVLTLQNLGERGLSAIERLPNLSELNVDTYSTGSDECDLSDLRALRSLTIYEIQCDQPRRLRPPTDLQRLGTSGAVANCLRFQSPPKIECVSVRLSVSPRRDSLTWLDSLPNSTQLTLVNTVDGDVQAVRNSGLLRALTLKGYCPAFTFGDDGMNAVASMTQLDSLRLERSNVTDMGIDRLRHLTQLRRLELYDLPRVTLDGLAVIGNLEKLRVLSLHYVSVPDSPIDDVLRKIRRLSELEEVSLDAVVTDRGLMHLAAFKKLRVLNLTLSEGFTDEGMAKLVESLPNLQVLML